jgi:hypothetical protein
MHPFAFSPGAHDSSIAKIRQVPGYLRLRLPQDFHEIANADFLIPHEI